MDSTNGMLQLLSSEKSYSNYRSCIHNISPPLVPYLGVYLTDLTFIEGQCASQRIALSTNAFADGNPDTIMNNDQELINCKKRDLVYDVIREISQYQVCTPLQCSASRSTCFC